MGCDNRFQVVFDVTLPTRYTFNGATSRDLFSITLAGSGGDVFPRVSNIVQELTGILEAGRYALTSDIFGATGSTQPASRFTMTFETLPPPPFSIDFFSIDGGGGSLLGGTFEISGGIGQYDATNPAVPITGGTFGLAGGLWVIGVPPPAPCPADINQDGDLNADDLADYINCYFASPPCGRADFNGDGAVNADDFGDFINPYFGASCLPSSQERKHSFRPRLQRDEAGFSFQASRSRVPTYPSGPLSPRDRGRVRGGKAAQSLQATAIARVSGPSGSVEGDTAHSGAAARRSGMLRAAIAMLNPSQKPAQAQIATLLVRLRQGDKEASGDLLGVLYSELRELAGRILRPQRDGHTLQPTALVHEAYMKLLGNSAPDFENRAHFFGCAARAMREVLIDRARARGAMKRGGDRERVTLVDADIAARGVEVDLLALDESLARLEKLNERHCRVIELRFFAGLDMDQTAAVLGVSARTVERDWRMARAWLRAELGE